MGLLERLANGADIASFHLVSIRRADLGLLERSRRAWLSPSGMGGFNPPGGFGAFGTRVKTDSPCDLPSVSIRRADLGLLEPHLWASNPAVFRFNPPGGFGAFGTRRGHGV
ncbi:hypothetical protein OSCT_0318 [Oscillochloris trichoides DG-6]|uniref:Uncharacterized protein n=1 Tax=Oscillochloris trichoides DG-6 TaxID=765420 RepID=E1IAG7_9CHLR|nr:hypothetical protein OSCT_0318 [Oscillochloris trichoides DG-6]